MAKRFVGACSLILALCLALSLRMAQAAEGTALSQGGSIFVPVYSHILIGDNARPFLLAVTLCLRNTSPSDEITLVSVDYYDSQGQLLKKHLDAPQTIRGLGSVSFAVAESDKQGGTGAKFIVRWRSSKPVSQPLAEAVMIGTSGQQGISFASRGQHQPD